MKRLAIIALVFFAASAQAATVGPGCSFAWDYVDPMPSHVDGFRLYVGGSVAWEGAVKTVTCATAGIDTSGEYSIYVTAYNAAGESAPSNIVGFTFAATAPSSPSDLRIEVN